MVTILSSLSVYDVEARARRVRLVVTDCDGTLTDGTVWYSARGEELVRFSRYDGMGVELLANEGIGTVIVTKEDSAIVRARASKLRVERVHTGVTDKLSFVRHLAAESGIGIDAMAFIGDDVNDVGAMTVIGERGLTAAPANATAPARRVAHLLTETRGGEGAFRELADFILSKRPSTQG